RVTEELDIYSKFNHALFHVYFQEQFFPNVLNNVCHCPHCASLALAKDNHIVCIAHKAVAPGLEFPVQLIQHNIAEQWAQWSALWYTDSCLFKLVRHHHTCLQVLMDKGYYPAVLDGS